MSSFTGPQASHVGGSVRSPPGLGEGHLDRIRASNGQVQAGFSGLGSELGGRAGFWAWPG